MRSLSNKGSAEFNNMSANFFKQIAREIVEQLTMEIQKVFNLTTGILPEKNRYFTREMASPLAMPGIGRARFDEHTTPGGRTRMMTNRETITPFSL